MIHLYLMITSPLKYDYFKNLGSIQGSLTKKLDWELDHHYYAKQLLEVQLQTQGTFRLTVGILGYSIDFAIYSKDCDYWR